METPDTSSAATPSRPELPKDYLAALDLLDRYRKALEHIATFQAETESDAEVALLMQECARGALDA